MYQLTSHTVLSLRAPDISKFSSLKKIHVYAIF